jgi:hypothetical protein
MADVISPIAWKLKAYKQVPIIGVECTGNNERVDSSLNLVINPLTAALNYLPTACVIIIRIIDAWVDFIRPLVKVVERTGILSGIWNA